MPKGVGNKKGKQPAKRPAPKWPASGQSEVVDMAELARQQALLD